MGKATGQYEAFHGHGVESRKRVRVAKLPKVVWALGELVDLSYRRPGRNERVPYRHTFKKPRPLLCYSPKTQRLYIVGGGYIVRAIGIVG